MPFKKPSERRIVLVASVTATVITLLVLLRTIYGPSESIILIPVVMVGIYVSVGGWKKYIKLLKGKPK